MTMTIEVVDLTAPTIITIEGDGVPTVIETAAAPAIVEVGVAGPPGPEGPEGPEGPAGGGGGASTASAVSFTPTGAIAATNVQSALAELDTEKAPTTHTHAGSAIVSVLDDAVIPSTIARDAEVTAQVDAAVNALVNAAPGTLDTLGEIAAALAADEAVVAALTTVVAEKVAKSLYDAHTILAAVTDDNPAALTVGEQTLVGRITGGNIAALTPAQIRTLLDLAALYQAADQDLTDLAAITRARGTLAVGGASAWQALALGAAGKVLGSDGTDAAYVNAARVHDTDAGATVTNTTTKTSLFTAPLSFPADLAVGDLLAVDAWGTYTNASGANANLTHEFSFLSGSPASGAVIVSPAQAMSAHASNTRRWNHRTVISIQALPSTGLAVIGPIKSETIFSVLSTAKVEAIDHARCAYGNDTLFSLGSPPNLTSFTFDYKITHGTAAASISMACLGASCYRIPKSV